MLAGERGGQRRGSWNRRWRGCLSLALVNRARHGEEREECMMNVTKVRAGD